MEKDWYVIKDIESVDSPALVIHVDRVRENIRVLKTFVPETDRLRPHVKTHKSAETSRLLLEAGITKFKCATIAEAEMLAMEKAPDVLLAYQPVGPKIARLSALIKKYPKTLFSCLIDSAASAEKISAHFEKMGMKINVWIDLNIGMNRTGISPANALGLVEHVQSLKGINLTGIHAYDGHLRESDLTIRTKQCDEGYAYVEKLRADILNKYQKEMKVIVGGSPTFSIHARRKNVECSPGTFIYWDQGYESTLKEQPFQCAAVIVSRVISKPSATSICIDLGHKSIASENPLTNRIHFLNVSGLRPVGHSEEHMVLEGDVKNLTIGDVLYGIPFHVCPTIALHEEAVVVKDNKVTGRWATTARKRMLSE